MRKLGVLVLSFFFCGIASAQSTEPATTWGYGYGAVGALVGDGSSNGILHLGAGGAGLLTGGFGAGIDLGYLTPIEGFSNGIGLLSPGVLYAFNRDAATVPYFGGGYTLFFREGAVHGFYVAGGVNHWFGERWGVQIEGRDQIMPEHNSHFIEARVSMLIR